MRYIKGKVCLFVCILVSLLKYAKQAKKKKKQSQLLTDKCWQHWAEQTHVTSWRKILSPNSSPSPPPLPSTLTSISPLLLFPVPDPSLLSSPSKPDSPVTLSHPPGLAFSALPSSLLPFFPLPLSNRQPLLFPLIYMIPSLLFFLFLWQNSLFMNPAWLLHQPLYFTSIFNYTCLSAWLQSTDTLWHHAKRIIGWWENVVQLENR